MPPQDVQLHIYGHHAESTGQTDWDDTTDIEVRNQVLEVEWIHAISNADPGRQRDVLRDVSTVKSQTLYPSLDP